MFSLNETNQFMVYSNSVDLRKRVDIKSQEAVKSLHHEQAGEHPVLCHSERTRTAQFKQPC